MDLEQLQKIGNRIIDGNIHSDWLPCMLDVLVTNTRISFAEDVEMGEDGNDWNRHQAKYLRQSHLLD